MKRLIGPVTVEEGLLQGRQILACHLIATVNQVGLCQPLVAPAALLEVEDGFLGLKHRALGDIDHAQLVEGLCGGQGTGGVFLDVGQQSCDAVLVIVEQLVQEHAVHRQGQVLHRHAYLVVGFFPVGGLQDAVPLLVTRHEVILHHLLRPEVGVLPDDTSHDGNNKCCQEVGGEWRVEREMFREAMDQERYSHQPPDRKSCAPEQPWEYRRIAVVVCASPQALNRYWQTDRAHQEIEQQDGNDSE